MSRERRGMAIIFSHEKFDDLSLKPRVGTKEDRDNLARTMGGLGFEVAVHDDLTYQELMKIVDEGKL
jgi:ketopantoate reductase